MRIIYICSSSTMYGDNIALLKLIPHLKNMGVEPFFVLPTKKEGDLVKTLNHLGYPYRTYDVFWSNWWKKGFIGICKTIIHHMLPKKSDYKRMLHDIQNFSPDLIHTNCSACNIGYQISEYLKIEHLWHIREYGVLDAGYHYYPTKSAFEKKIIKPLNHCICITEDIYRYFNSPITGQIIYDGVFDTELLPKIAEQVDNYFLFVGRLTPTKGINLIINTFLHYCQKNNADIKLKIAGTGEAKFVTILKEQAKQHSKGHLIEFLGYREDVVALMTKAKALIVASRCEGFGFISVEAMLCGCPVIGHNVGGTKIQFDNGLAFTGHEIGLRYQTEKELEECMTVIAHQERSKLMPMLHDAQETVMHYYTARKSATKVFQFYQKILSKQ